MRKGLLVGKVTADPRWNDRCLRFEAEFSPFEITEVTVDDRELRKKARIIKIGDKIAIGKWARLDYLKIKANEIIRLVDVKDSMVVKPA